MNAAIEFKGICKSFPGVKALKDINLSIESGEIHAIVGENGAGKSTLISILGGIYQPDEGSVILEGKPITIRNQHESLQIGIGIVYQEIKLCPNLTIAENIFLGRELDPDGKRIRKAHMESETLNLLQELGSNLSPSERVGNLSVASQQIVEIARAISRKAKILIMDEPTSALTVKESANLFTNILDLKSKGVTILYISHRMEEVFKLSDRISILRDGRHIGTFEKGKIDPQEVVNLIAGKELATELKHHVQCCVDYGRPVLEGKNLSRPGCFRDISFTLYEREILGIYGMQGSGRTELLETIFGLAPEWSGELYCFGKPVRNADPSEAIRNGFAMVPENRRDSGIFPDMSIIENVNSANWREIRGVLGGLRMSVMRRICSDSMSSLNVKNSDQGKKIKQLSGGNQQKVVIAKWLATHPRILLVDEPTRGIDVGAKAEIFKIIKGLREEGLSVIIVSSELSEVISESDRILVMKNGSLVVTLTSEEATRERIIQYAL